MVVSPFRSKPRSIERGFEFLKSLLGKVSHLDQVSGDAATRESHTPHLPTRANNFSLRLLSEGFNGSACVGRSYCSQKFL
jgi:hypothetical protein